MIKRLRCAAALLAAYFVLSANLASALPIKEFRKFSSNDQATYIMAAISMLAYTYASGGDVAKARCVQNWYFGHSGVQTQGPSEIAIEMDVAERLDAAKYHVEGVIMGVTDKACPATKSKP